MLSRSLVALLPTLGTLLAGPACSDDADGSAGGAAGAGGAGGVPPALDFIAGGDRPVTVRVPVDYDPAVPAPLIVLLHGYGATGFLQDVYLELSGAALARGAIFAAPDGTRDDDDRPFWNASDACCNFHGSSVDDVAYLLGLLDEIAASLNVDPARVFIAGHSNGGFMAHRMACEHADRVSAIISFAGMGPLDPADCGATEAVSVLQIHGTEDLTILYEGGAVEEDPFPSVAQTLATWIAIDGCDPEPVPGEPLDLDVSIDGAETQVTSHGFCEAGAVVEHWAIVGGSHIPPLFDAVGGQLADWLLAHPDDG